MSSWGLNRFLSDINALVPLFFSELVTRYDEDMVTSLLFNPDQGIVYFLKKSLDKSAHIAAKVIFLEFTAEYISRSPSAMTHFIVEIKARFFFFFVMW